MVIYETVVFGLAESDTDILHEMENKRNGTKN